MVVRRSIGMGKPRMAFQITLDGTTYSVTHTNPRREPQVYRLSSRGNRKVAPDSEEYERVKEATIQAARDKANREREKARSSILGPDGQPARGE